MAQKLVAQAEPPVRSFNQTGNICNARTPVAWKFNHADDRMQRGKRIRRDLRARSRDFAQWCRFARVRITNEPCIGDRSQLEQKISLLTFFPFGVFARRAIAGTLEMHVTLTPCSALAKHKVLSIAGKIDNGN